MIEIYAHEFKLASETLAAKMLSGDVKREAPITRPSFLY
jgi:hypothetical protein